MAERDLEFTAGVVFNSGPLTAEIQRLTATLQQAGAALNLQGPIEAAGAAARRAAQDFRAVDLSLVNITKSAASVSEQYIAQQAALKKVETAIRTISQLPITTQKQYDALLALEALQKRLSALTAGSRDLDLNTPQKLAQVMAGATTQMARFEAELKGVAQAQRQVATLSEAMRVALSSRMAVDPSYIATLTRLREIIGQVGPLGQASFAELQREIARFEGQLGSATQMELKFSDALNMNQRDAMRVAAAYQTIEKALLAQERASEAAGIREQRRLQEIIKLQTRVAALPVTAQSTAITGQLAGMQGPGQDPVRIAALKTQILQLETANNLAAASAKKLAVDIDTSGNAAKRNVGSFAQLEKSIDSLSSRIQRQTEFILAAAASYAAFNAITGVVHHIVELDQAMHRVGATIQDHNERLVVLPQAYALIQRAMTDFGLSTQDAGKLVTELTRSLNGNIQQIQSAFLPALALTVRGEVDMAEASRVLIGAVNAFGPELLGASSKLEAYGLAADKIIKASDQSVGSIGSLAQALNNVASRAALAGVTFSQTISLLSLLQDNLGAAGRSGTGLTRVFEGLILNADKAAKLFGVAFDPAAPIDAFGLLGQVIAKLNEELARTGGLTSELANRFQVLIGTEQGTKQLELLVRAWPELAKRIQESTAAGGRHIAELEAHSAQLGVSFTRMTNQMLVSIDKIINGFEALGGGKTGLPGQFRGLAGLLTDIGNIFEGIGNNVERTGKRIGAFVNDLRALGTALTSFSLPTWIENLLLASGGTHRTNIAVAADDVGLLQQALAALPDPPEWFKMMLARTTAAAIGAGIGAAVSGPAAPLGALGGGIAGWMAFDFAQWSLDAAAAKKQLEELTKATAMYQAQRSGERVLTTYISPEDRAAKIEQNRLEIATRRGAMIAEVNEKIRSEIALSDQNLALEIRIGEARKVAAISRKAVLEAEKEFRTGALTAGRLESDSLKALAGLKQKNASDEMAVNTLRAQLAKNQLADQKAAYELEEKRVATIAKLTTEWQKATASTATPFQDLSMDQALADINTKIRAVAKEWGGLFHSEFAMKVEGLITQTVIAELTNKQQAIFDAFVTPYRDASQVAIAEIDKIIERAEYLARQPSLSPEARAETLATPKLAVDKLLGVDVAERQLKSLTATFNQFGEEAAQAAFAASRGFDSFNDMIIQADINAMGLSGRGLRELINGFLRLRQTTQAIDLQQLKNDIAATAKAIADTLATGGDPARILANAAAWDKYKKSLDDLELSADGAERSVAALLLVNSKQIITKGSIENLQTQLLNLKNTNDGIVASFGQTGAAAIATQLAFQLEGKSVEQLSAHLKILVTDIAAATQKQKELADAAGLEAIGFSPTAAASMAAALAKHEELNKTIDQGTEALNRWAEMGETAAIRQVASLTRVNQRAEVSYQRQLELVKQTAIGANDYFSFLAASFQQSATAGHSFFEDLDTLAKNTASSMRTAFSDIFFAVLQNNMKDAQAAFKNFFLSILREITNLMASQAVKGFLGLFGINVQGGQLSFSGLAGGLFGGGSGNPPGGSPISGSPIGESPLPGGMNSAGFAPGEVGGDPFSAIQMGEAAVALLGAGKSLAGAGTIWTAIASGWTAGTGLTGGLASAASAGFTAMKAAFTGLTAVVGIALAVVQGALVIMDDTKSNLGKAIQTATLAAGIALSWETGGLSLIAAAVINWIEDLFGLFDKGISKYTQKRIDATEKANAGLKTLQETYQGATTTGDPAQVLQALRTRTAGEAGPGRGAYTIMLATPEMAANLGLKVDPRNMQEGKFEVAWDDVTQAQFNELLRLLIKDENLISGMVGGRVSVDYLQQDKVTEAQRNAAAIGEAMLTLFVAFRRIREEVTKLVDDVQDAVKDLLPEDLAGKFKASLLDPIREQIITALSSGLSIESVTAKLENLKATLVAYVNLVGLYGQLTQDFASYSGDFNKSLALLTDSTQKAVQAATKKITVAAKDVGLGPDLVDPTTGLLLNTENALQKVQQAFANMELTPVQAFERLSALRTAVIERYELEMKLVKESEAGIAKLYSEHVTGVIAFQQALAGMQTAMTGSDSGLNNIVQQLLRIGTTSLSVSESLYTVGAALQVFIESLPTRIAGKAGRPDDPSLGAGALPVDQILAATLGVVVPFAAVLNREIRNAFDAGDFEAAFHLVQQLGAGLKSAMEAAVAGVRQWEAATIAMINREADLRIKAGDEVRKGIQANIDGQRKYVEGVLKEIQRQRDAIQDQRVAVEDQIRAIHDAMKPLEDQIKAITRAQEQLRRSMRPIDQAIRGIGELMRPISAQLTTLERQATAIQRVADDQLWNIGLQTHALEKQRDTIQDEIDLIEEMANAVLSVREYLHDLALSQQAPPDAIGQFQLAKGTFDELFAAFKQDPTAKGLTKLQEAAQDLFGTLNPLFERPSTEYRELYESIVRKLEKAARLGATIGEPATLDDLKDQLKVVDGQLDTLNTTAEGIRRDLELQLHAIELIKRPLDDQLLRYQDQIDALNLIKDGIQHQIDLLEDQKGLIQDQLDLAQPYLDALDEQLGWLARQDALLSRQETTLNRDLARIAEGQDWLNQAWQDYVDSINFQRDQAIDATETAAGAIIDSIEEAMMPLMTAVGTDAHLFYEWMRTTQYERLMDLTSGQGTAAWMKTAQTNTATWTLAIKTALEGFLAGDMRAVTAAVTDETTEERLIRTLDNLDGSIGSLDTSIGTLNTRLGTPAAGGGASMPAPEGPTPNAQGGARYVHQGIYQLHEGEMVAPRAQAEALRSATDGWASLSRLAEGGGGGNTYISIAPVIHSNQNPAAIVNQVVDRIVVDIRGGGAIQDAIARMPKRSR